jgi:hypothetical protein
MGGECCRIDVNFLIENEEDPTQDALIPSKNRLQTGGRDENVSRYHFRRQKLASALTGTRDVND